MATLEEAIAVDLSRWHKAGRTWLWMAQQITGTGMIAEGLKLREQKLIELGGRGLR